MAEVVNLADWKRRFGPATKPHTGIIALDEPPLLPVVDGMVRSADLHKFIRHAREYEKGN